MIPISMMLIFDLEEVISDKWLMMKNLRESARSAGKTMIPIPMMLICDLEEVISDK